MQRKLTSRGNPTILLAHPAGAASLVLTVVILPAQVASAQRRRGGRECRQPSRGWRSADTTRKVIGQPVCQ